MLGVFIASQLAEGLILVYHSDMVGFSQKALSLTFHIPVGCVKVEKWWVGREVTRQMQHVWHLCKGNPQPDL